MLALNVFHSELKWVALFISQ